VTAARSGRRASRGLHRDVARDPAIRRLLGAMTSGDHFFSSVKETASPARHTLFFA
jgi:hypothetical protein